MTVTAIERRRPHKTRASIWARAMAGRLAASQTSPGLLAACSLALAVLGAALLCASGLMEGLARAAMLIAAAACIQGRLLANMLGAMVAADDERPSAYGLLWNELPDRAADILLLIGAGYGAYAAGHAAAPEFGWACALLAVSTAYVRQFGVAIGLPADFSGPMAKPQRMAVLTLACGVSLLEPLWRWNGQTLMIALAVIALGCVLTIVRRIRHIRQALRDRRDEAAAT